MFDLKGVLKIEGNFNVIGIVNSNGNSPTYHKMKKFDSKGVELKNHSFAKTDRDGLDFTSSNCLRKAIFNPDEKTVEPNTPAEQDEFSSSFTGLLRGYMFTNKKTASLVRKSPVCVLDAYSTEQAVFTETCTRSGLRDETSFFTRDNAGLRKQKLEIYIDLKELSILKNNEIDGLSFNCSNSDMVALLNKSFSQKVASSSDKGVSINEKGLKIVLSHFINSLENLRIIKSDAKLDVELSSLKFSLNKETFNLEDFKKHLAP